MTGEALRILLVEDNPAHVELITRNLQSHQVANIIHHVSDGKEALHHLQGSGLLLAGLELPTEFVNPQTEI